MLDWNVDRGKHADSIIAAARGRRCPVRFLRSRLRRKADGRQRGGLAIGRGSGNELRVCTGLPGVEPKHRSRRGLYQSGDADSNTNSFGADFTLQAPVRSFGNLISKWPLFQRRLALVTEIGNDGQAVVLYNLSRGDDDLRLEQIDEVLADPER